MPNGRKDEFIVKDEPAMISDIDAAKRQARTDNYNLWEDIKGEFNKLMNTMSCDLRDEMKANRVMTEKYFEVTTELLRRFEKDHNGLIKRVDELEIKIEQIKA